MIRKKRSDYKLLHGDRL